MLPSLVIYVKVQHKKHKLQGWKLIFYVTKFGNVWKFNVENIKLQGWKLIFYVIKFLFIVCESPTWET